MENQWKLRTTEKLSDLNIQDGAGLNIGFSSYARYDTIQA